MSETAFIFPGQGSQHIGMGKDLYDVFPAARDTFDAADEILGFALSRVCFEGPEERLRETRYTQLAILVHSVAAWRVIEETLHSPGFVAGHSVGEYAALVASASLAYADALRLVKVRAEAMYSSGIDAPGGMAAIIGMPDGNLDDMLADAGQAGIIAVANFNSPVQTVVSGEVEAVEKAIAVARSHGAKRAIRLNVSGAFHSPLMKVAEEELAAALRTVDFSEARIPIVSNVTAEAVTEPVKIVDLLQRQLTSPVLWFQSMTYMLDRGITSFVEIGPGNVLCGLLKRINPEARCTPCSDKDGVDNLLKGVAA